MTPSTSSGQADKAQAPPLDLEKIQEFQRLARYWVMTSSQFPCDLELSRCVHDALNHIDALLAALKTARADVLEEAIAVANREYSQASTYGVPGRKAFACVISELRVMRHTPRKVGKQSDE